MRKITEITVLEEFKVELTYDNGKKIVVDFQKKIGASEIFQPLANKVFFSQVSISPNGRYIHWDGEIELCADALWYKGTGEQFSIDEKEAS